MAHHARKIVGCSKGIYLHQERPNPTISFDLNRTHVHCFLGSDLGSVRVPEHVHIPTQIRTRANMIIYAYMDPETTPM